MSQSWEADSLLAKRLAFAHEREVRLIYVARADMDVSSNLHPYQVDPSAMIDQIMIDPRQSAADAERTRSEIREETLYRGDIVRSLLYAPPPRLRLMIKIPTSPKRRRREKYIPEYHNGTNVPMVPMGDLRAALKPAGMKSRFSALPTPFESLMGDLRDAPKPAGTKGRFSALPTLIESPMPKSKKTRAGRT